MDRESVRQGELCGPALVVMIVAKVVAVVSVRGGWVVVAPLRCSGWWEIA